MAEFRNIHTRIWKDTWFSELETDAKLLFIYLFSNERASVCGMFELPLKYIIFETGMEKSRVEEILSQFEQDKKVYYRDGVVWVVNLKRYNDSGNSPKVQVRINKDLEDIPACELKQMYYLHHKIPYPYPMDTLSGIEERDGDRDGDRYRDGDGDRGNELPVDLPQPEPVSQPDPIPPSLPDDLIVPAQKSAKPKSVAIPKAELEPIVTALANVTGRDLMLNYGRLAKEAKDLHLAGYSDGDILTAFGEKGSWYQRDWRGKRGERPPLGVIRDLIRDLLSPAPVSVSNPTNGAGRMDTPLQRTLAAGRKVLEESQKGR